MRLLLLLLLLLLLVATPVWAQPNELPPLTPPETALRSLGWYFGDSVPVVTEGVPTIDVLYVRTQGTSEATCQGITDRFNEVSRNSQVAVRTRLVGCRLLAQASSGSLQSDLTRLNNPNDGFFDEAHGWRNEMGADIVQIIVPSDTGGGAGLGYLLSTAISAFSAVVEQYAVGYISGPHEQGHNIGMQHNKENGSNYLLPYGYGWRAGNWRTVMAYAPGDRIPYWSNPSVTCPGGIPCGTALADNARVLRERAPLVAGFKSAVDGPVPPAWPEEAITVVSDEAADALRLSLIQQMWDRPALPSRIASSVTLNVGTAVLESPTPLPNVQRVDRYTIKTYGQTLSTYLIRPAVSSGALSVVTLGHAVTGTLAGLTTSVAMVTESLVRGSAVLLVPMPLNSTTGHDALGLHAYAGFSPLQYFLDSAVVALNTYLTQNPAPSTIVGMGVSGGGWGLTLLGTIDTRYQRTFAVAGSLPIPLRSVDPAEFGDWEQRLPALTRADGQPLDYLDLYLAAASDGRFHTQINNQTDTCCFSGTKDTQYAPDLTAINPRYTFTRVSAPQHGITAAQVTSLIGPVLGPVLVVPPVSYTQILDNGDAGFSVTGPNWFHRTDEGNAYQGDIHHVSPGCGTGGTGTRMAQWAFTGVPDADVKVSVTWSAYQNRATNTPFVVKDVAGNVLASAVYNQQLWPTGTTYNGKVFQLIGTVRTTTGSITVQMTDNANACVIADAVRVGTN